MKRLRIKILFTLISPLLASAICYGGTIRDSIIALVPRDTAVYRYGYLELNQTNRALYDTILGSLIRFEANYDAPYQHHRCDLTGVSNSRNTTLVMNDLARLQNDIPELFILSSYIPRYDYTNYIYYARIGYLNTPENYLSNLLLFQTAYQECSQGITDSMSTYEKVLTLHDNYCRRTTYGDMTGADASTAKGSLINKRAVCEGIARGWLYLCQQADIPCIYVAGRLLSQGNHAWNYTMVDGKWYMMDVTADCSLITKPGHAGFLRGNDYQSEHYSLFYTDGSDANCNGVYQSLPTLSTRDYEPTSPTDFSSSISSTPSQFTKIMQNGRLLILGNGKQYTMQGEEVK